MQFVKIWIARFLRCITYNPSSRGGSICLIYSTTTAAVLPVYPPIPSHIIYIAGWFGVGMGGWFSWVEMEVMATLLHTHKMWWRWRLADLLYLLKGISSNVVHTTPWHHVIDWVHIRDDVSSMRCGLCSSGTGRGIKLKQSDTAWYDDDVMIDDVLEICLLAL